MGDENCDDASVGDEEQRSTPTPKQVEKAQDESNSTEMGKESDAFTGISVGSAVNNLGNEFE